MKREKAKNKTKKYSKPISLSLTNFYRIIMTNLSPEEAEEKYHISKTAYKRAKSLFGDFNQIRLENKKLKQKNEQIKEKLDSVQEMNTILDQSEIFKNATQAERLNAAEKIAQQVDEDGKQLYRYNTITKAFHIPSGSLRNRLFRGLQGKTKAKERHDKLVPIIREIWEKSHRIYGSRKIWIMILRTHPEIGRVNYRYVSQIMKEEKISAPKQKYSYSVSRKHWRKKYASIVKHIKGDKIELKNKQIVYRLVKKFDADRPNYIWCTDYTYFNLENGSQIVLITIIDVYSRKVITWNLYPTPNSKHTIDTIKKAVQIQKQAPVYLHSDLGPEFSSNEVISECERLKIKNSYSRAGRPSDNPIAEHFFSTLKTEVAKIHEKKVSTKEELTKLLNWYINWYNTERIHGAINYETPIEREKGYYNKKRDI